LPAPVAIFKRLPRQTGIRGVVGFDQLVLDPGVAVLASDLGDIHRRLKRLNLAEEELVFPLGIRPVLKQAQCRGRDAEIPTLSPEVDAATNPVDVLVLLDPVLRPLRCQRELQVALFLGAWNRHEVGADPALFNDLVGDAVIIESEMARGFDERRIEDRILDHDLGHHRPSKAAPSGGRWGA
jgi:hypothetical protein